MEKGMKSVGSVSLSGNMVGEMVYLYKSLILPIKNLYPKKCLKQSCLIHEIFGCVIAYNVVRVGMSV